MRIFSAITLLFFFQMASAQLIIKPIAQKENPKKATTKLFPTAAPATLPFWDDFSISTNSADSIRIWGNNTTAQWDYDSSKNVYINATLAINPPTYKVATFDGLDANGAFHLDNELGLADQLQSVKIDLSTYNESDDIFISFYWQAGGNVEKPDEGDSLRLQFFNPNSSNNDPWTTIWSMEGDEQLQDSIFTQEIFKVEQTYLTSKFAFRFQSFGDLDGPFDAWHIDWVYMNAGRNINDKVNGYEDGALSGQLSSPITPFSSIPVHQLTTDNKYIKNQKIAFSYLNRIPGEFYQIDVTYNVELTNNNFTLLNDPNRASNLLTAVSNYDSKILGQTDQSDDADSVFLADQDFTSLIDFDSVVIETEVYLKNNNELDAFLDNSQVDLRVNDTIKVQYLLHNYYAYDDGTAEYAAGTNVLDGQVAVQFWLEEQDTLTHVAFHFPNIAPSAIGKPLTLNIFKELNTNGLATRSQQINVKSDSAINGFTYYELSRPLIVSDTFYVSYQQSTSDYVGIGFDRSNVEASNFIYENKGDGWEKNIRLQGALMIRPIFKNIEDYRLGNRQPKSLKIFPNPTNGVVSIDGNYTYIEVMDISGRLYLQEKAKSHHDLSELEVGLYLLKVHQLDGERTYKIIKK